MRKGLPFRPFPRWNLLWMLSLTACSNPSNNGSASDGGSHVGVDSGQPSVTSDAAPLDATAHGDGSMSEHSADATAPLDAATDGGTALDGSTPPDAGSTLDGGTPVDASQAHDASGAQDGAADASQTADAGCPTGYAPDGHGGCSNVDDCVGNQCLRGACVDGVNAYSCDCSGTGYEGTRCEVPVSSCPVPNLCTSNAYPCVQTTNPGYTCLGQLADWPMPDLGPNAAHAPSYDTSTVGVVVDKVTGLTWTQDIPALYAGCSTVGVQVKGDSCTWAEAVHYCDQLVLNTQSDWRLPSKIELESILDETHHNPALDTAVWPAPLSKSGVFGNLWTSSPYAGGGAYWAVDFVNGWSVTNAASVGNRVRCVRGVSNGSSTPDQRYVVDAAADTVTDTITGLTWQRAASGGLTAMDFNVAQSWCSLSVGFRLPTLKELLTLVDPTRRAPSLDPSFPNVTGASDWFWTVSVDPSNGQSNYAYAVSFYDGISTSYKTTESHYVRCVR